MTILPLFLSLPFSRSPSPFYCKPLSLSLSLSLPSYSTPLSLRQCSSSPQTKQNPSTLSQSLSTMAPSLKLPFLLLIALSATTLTASSSDSSEKCVAELFSLQYRSESGVIHLNDQSLSRFLTSVATPHPRSILLFFDAAQLHDKPELCLRDLHHEFSIISSSFIANHNTLHPSRSKLFFLYIEFKEQGHALDHG